jgi:hypothetical protein
MSNNVIQFPNTRQRIGSKHRQAEIEMLQRHLLLVDEDMETVLNQLDCLNQDLIELKVEYDNLLKRLTKLLDQETKE